MKKESDIDNLISKRLKERIESLPEQEYVQGAWESFKVANAANIKRESRLRTTRIFTYSTIGVAALLLIGLFLFNRSSQDFTLSNYPLDSPISAIENRITVIKNPAVTIDQPALDITSPKAIASESAKNSERSSLLAELRERQIVRERVTQKGSEITDKVIVEKSPIKPNIKSSTEKENSNIFEGDSKVAERKLLHFGINISPGFSSSPINSGGTFNYSGGVSLDIEITKNLQISTGLQIEHQSVVGKSKTRSTDVVPGHVDAVLTNLDIPINIKWRFFSNKSKSYYVSGGLSSLAYLNEKYTTTSYNHQIRANTVVVNSEEQFTTYKIENVETVQTTSISPSNAFDVAGRVNIILGYEQRISPKLNLHIEPFIKVPLSGLATENIRFTTGGVTFKISF